MERYDGRLWQGPRNPDGTPRPDIDYDISVAPGSAFGPVIENPTTTPENNDPNLLAKLKLAVGNLWHALIAKIRSQKVEK